MGISRAYPTYVHKESFFFASNRNILILLKYDISQMEREFIEMRKYNIISLAIIIILTSTQIWLILETKKFANYEMKYINVINVTLNDHIESMKPIANDMSDKSINLKKWTYLCDRYQHTIQKMNLKFYCMTNTGSKKEREKMFLELIGLENRRKMLLILIDLCSDEQQKKFIKGINEQNGSMLNSLNSLIVTRPKYYILLNDKINIMFYINLIIIIITTSLLIKIRVASQ